MKTTIRKSKQEKELAERRLPTPKPLLTDNELRQALNMTKYLFRKVILDPAGPPCVRPNPRRRLWELEVVLAWLNKQRNAGVEVCND